MDPNRIDCREPCLDDALPGRYRPETRVITYVLTCVLVAQHFLQRAVACGTSLTIDSDGRTELRLHPIQPAGALLIPFLAYAALNVLTVTPVPWLGWMDWLTWANMVAIFWVTLNGVRSPRPRQFLFVMLVLLGGWQSGSQAISDSWIASGSRSVDIRWSSSSAERAALLGFRTAWLHIWSSWCRRREHSLLAGKQVQRNACGGGGLPRC